MFVAVLLMKRCSAMSISVPALFGEPMGFPIVGDCIQNADHIPAVLSKSMRASM